MPTPLRTLTLNSLVLSTALAVTGATGAVTASGATATPPGAPSSVAGSPTAASTTFASPGTKPLPALKMVVTIAPLSTIATRLAPDGSTVEQLIPSGVSEHGYEVPPSKLITLAGADVVIRIGAGLEPQIDKALAAPAAGKPSAGTNRRIVTMAEVVGGGGVSSGDTGGGTGSKPAAAESGNPPAPAPNSDTKTKPPETKPADNHDHAHSHDHDHGACDHDNDMHWWLDPIEMEKLAIATAKAIKANLTARLATEAERVAAGQAIDAKLASLVADIQSIDALYRATLAGKAHRTIVVTHDAWGHLAERYDLKTVALKGLTAAEPTIANLKLASETIRERKLSTVFTEPQLSPDAAKRIASGTGAKVASLDPLGNGDWFAMMRTNLRAIASALPDAPAKDVAPVKGKPLE